MYYQGTKTQNLGPHGPDSRALLMAVGVQSLQSIKASKDGAASIEEERSMIPLHQDPWFTFRFAEDRLIPRFHLEGASPSY